jgi:hypothetical protein
VCRTLIGLGAYLNWLDPLLSRPFGFNVIYGWMENIPTPYLDVALAYCLLLRCGKDEIFLFDGNILLP